MLHGPLRGHGQGQPGSRTCHGELKVAAGVAVQLRDKRQQLVPAVPAQQPVHEAVLQQRLELGQH